MAVQAMASAHRHANHGVHISTLAPSIPRCCCPHHVAVLGRPPCTAGSVQLPPRHHPACRGQPRRYRRRRGPCRCRSCHPLCRPGTRCASRRAAALQSATPVLRMNPQGSAAAASAAASAASAASVAVLAETGMAGSVPPPLLLLTLRQHRHEVRLQIVWTTTA
eukprot:366360-Chlamydomonas_euryale.AAC.2